MAHRYEALDQGYIRLMVLKAGSKEDALLIELETVHIGLAVSFEAISYVWGDKPRIEIRGAHGSFMATKSLEQALRVFRCEDRDRMLWADAICINQTDSVERAQQVKMMAQIYGYAQRVLVWLGPLEFARQAFEAASKLVSDIKYQHLLIGALHRGRPSAAVSYLRQLAQMPWFQRTWTMQEIGVAYEATFFCEDASISWTELSQAYNILYQQIGKESPEVMRLPVNQLRDIRTLRTWKGDRNVSFLDLLALAARRHATDARDKVFALLSHPTALVNESGDQEQLVVDPDYLKDVAEVYVDTAKGLIQKHHNLDVLSHVAESHELQWPYRMKGLPSWVPDWSWPPALRNLFSSQGTFAACSDKIDTKPQFIFDYGLWEMHARAALIGTVTWRRTLSLWENWPLMPTRTKQYDELMYAWNDVKKNISASPRQYIPEADLLSSFGSCLTGGMLHPKFNFPDAKKSYDTAFQWFWNDIKNRPGPEFTTHIPSRFLDAVLYACQGRALFCTDSGYIGLGPHFLQAGDEVFVLSLGRIPLALRPNERISDWYSLVGECYVDGMMHGEAANLVNAFRREIVLR